MTSSQAESATGYFASHCDRVRVMPLLRGTPCSIHCVVSPDEIAPLWPVRVDATLDIDTGMFSYVGADWVWSTTVQLVESAQRFATQAAALMREHAGYRGVFCVDGVAVGDVFHPTEVNSRWGASLTTLASQQPEVALRFIHAFLADGFDADPAGIVMAEVFHHGSVHREQICAMLTGHGVEPPDIQPWGFADATGVSRFVGGRTS